MYSIIY